MLRRPSQRAARIDDLHVDSLAVDGYHVGIGGRCDRDFDRSIFPPEPVDSRFDGLNIQDVLLSVYLRLDDTMLGTNQFDLQPFTIDDRGVLHEDLRPRRRASSFQNMSLCFSGSAAGTGRSE